MIANHWIDAKPPNTKRDDRSANHRRRLVVENMDRVIRMRSFDAETKAE